MLCNWVDCLAEASSKRGAQCQYSTQPKRGHVPCCKEQAGAPLCTATTDVLTKERNKELTFSAPFCLVFGRRYLIFVRNDEEGAPSVL